MENEVTKKYLPIGTVVLLKDGKKELMITGYGTIPSGDIYDKNGKVEQNGITVFDYCGYFYPEGLISSDNIFAFNNEQIDKVIFKGYESENYKEFSDGLAKSIENIKIKIAEMSEKLKDDIAKDEKRKQLLELAEEGQQ